MRLTIAAVGRLKAGPERELYDRYVKRAADAGRRIGLTVSTREFPESRAGSAEARAAQEATALLGAASEEAVVVALDERGRNLASDAFAERLAGWRDGGTGEVVFTVGGPDGLAPAVTGRAELRLAFGALTWPHQLARVMLAEQVYRAVTILSGHPYHRA